MIQTSLMKILVTVWLAGQPPMTELLPREYSATDNKCQAAVNALFPRLRHKGLTVKLECVEAQTRGL